MALTPLDLLGQENMNAEAKETVIGILAGINQPDTVKRLLYQQWARLAGVPVIDADLDRVAPNPLPA